MENLKVNPVVETGLQVWKSHDKLNKLGDERANQQ